ncbi:hypothetical protein RUM44_001912 [Polyplax serrata]|uniref:Uncharacterized protein n=1 Tax=Polyplax serrata TaxID=468196 RepID=A0ABR1ALD3_POLSC
MSLEVCPAVNKINKVKNGSVINRRVLAAIDAIAQVPEWQKPISQVAHSQTDRTDLNFTIFNGKPSPNSVTNEPTKAKFSDLWMLRRVRQCRPGERNKRFFPVLFYNFVVCSFALSANQSTEKFQKPVLLGSECDLITQVMPQMNLFVPQRTKIKVTFVYTEMHQKLRQVVAQTQGKCAGSRPRCPVVAKSTPTQLWFGICHDSGREKRTEERCHLFGRLTLNVAETEEEEARRRKKKLEETVKDIRSNRTPRNYETILVADASCTVN